MNLKKNKKINQYWLFTILIGLVLVFPYFMQKGMFLDGVTYAVISKNLANGIGTFFQPHYTKTLSPVFYEHPPFVFWLQSVFFKILGNHYMVEKLYSLLTGVLTGMGIILLWNFFSKEDSKKNNWFVLLLWILTPLVFWSFSNNILENTVSVFVVFSVFFTLNFLKTKKYFYIILSSSFIVMAFLSKGFIGVFPIVVPIIYAFSLRDRNFKKPLLTNLILITCVLLLSWMLVFIFPELKNNILNYFDTQLIPSIQGKREITVGNRFKIIFNLLIELIFPILLCAVLFIRRKKKNQYKKESLFFFLVGISASLPLIISLKQRTFYLIPSLPFYVLSLCFLILPFIKPQLENFYQKKIKIIQGINFLLSIIILYLFTNINEYSRDKKELQDIEKITKVISEGSVLSISNDISNKWQTIAYFARENNISLTKKTKKIN